MLDMPSGRPIGPSRGKVINALDKTLPIILVTRLSTLFCINRFAF